MNLLAHKKVLVGLLMGGTLIGIAYATARKEGLLTYKSDVSEGNQVLLSELINKDTDADGVKDWEETLWGTDAKKRDSNDDGTPDGVEIARRREAAGLSAVSASTTLSTTNETDAFARELFTTILSLKQNNQLNDATIENLSKALLEGAVAEKTAERYSGKDLLTAGTSREDIESYGESLTALSNRYKTYKVEDELVVIARALEKEDRKELSPLAATSNLYERMAGEIIKLKAPPAIAVAHLGMANSYAAISLSLKKIGVLFDNPVVGFAGLILHERALTTLYQNLDTLNSYFVENDILLNKK